MIWTPAAAIDPTTPEGMLLLGITSMMDGVELGKMKARMLGARESKAGFSGHAIPRGVTYTNIRGQRGGIPAHAPAGSVDTTLSKVPGGQLRPSPRRNLAGHFR